MHAAAPIKMIVDSGFICRKTTFSCEAQGLFVFGVFYKENKVARLYHWVAETAKLAGLDVLRQNTGNRRRLRDDRRLENNKDPQLFSSVNTLQTLVAETC